MDNIGAVPKTGDLIAKYELEEVQATKLREAVILQYRLMPPPGLPIDRHKQQLTQDSLDLVIKAMSPAALAAFEEFLKGLLIALEPPA